MKRINVKLLLILLISGVTFLVGVYLLHDFQARRRADGLLVLAEQQKEAGDFSKEAQIRRSYLNRRPEDTTQYPLLATAYTKDFESHLAEGTFRPEIFQEARKFYELSVRSDPTNAEQRRTAIDFFIRMRMYKDAISHLEYLASQQGKLEPLLESQLAMCYFRGGEEQRAREMLTRMVGFDGSSFNDEEATAPDSLEAHRLLAMIYSTARRLDISRRILDHYIDRNPESAEGYLSRARQFYESDRELARRDFEKALELESENEDILLANSQAAADSGDWSRAEEFCRRTLEVNPDNVLALRGLALAAATQNRAEDAMDYIDQALEKAPNNVDFLMLRVDFQLRMRKLDKVEETIRSLRDLGLQRFYRDYLIGRLNHAKGEWHAAVKKLEEARPHIEQGRPQLLNQVDLLLSQCYENLGQHDLRLTAMQKAVERNPENLQLRWFKIQSLLALKRLDDALGEYRDIRGQLNRLPPTSEEFLIQHLQLELMRQKSFEEGQRDFTEAKALVEKVIKAKRINTAVKTTTLATYFEMIGEKERAEELMARLRETASGSPAMRLADIKERGYQPDGFDDALKQLDELVNETGDLVPYRLLRAELLTAKKPDGYEEQLAALAEQTDAYNDQERFVLWTELGRYRLIAGQHDETLALWQRAKAVSPSNIDLLMKIYDVALLSEDKALIKTASDDLRRLAGENSAEWKWARAARITLDIRNGKVPRTELSNAQGLVDEAIELREAWEQLYRLRGEIASLQGRQDVAVTAFQQAIDLGSTNVGLHQKLARMYYAAQRLSDAKNVLAKLPQSAWTKLEQRIQLDVLAREGNLPEQVPYDTESADPTDHIFIAQIFSRAERFEEAEAALSRAVELDPEAPAAWGARIQYHVLRGQAEAANATIEAAAPRIPEAQRSIFLATSYGMMGQWERSIEHYREALVQKPDDEVLQIGLASSLLKSDQIAEAKEVLQGLIDGDSGEFSTPTVAMARRTLAEVTAKSGVYEDYQKAMSLLRTNEERLGALTNDDLVLGARLAARRVEQATRREALDKMETVQERGKLSDPAKLVMAELYEGLNEWGSTQSLMLDMLSRNPDDQQLLDRWLTWLVKRGNFRQAERWVDNANPASAIYNRTKALVDANKGQSERAIRRLKSLVPKELNETTLPTLRTMALMMEEIGEFDARAYDEAEAMWKSYVRANKDAALELALHYKRRGDPAKAIDGFKVCKAVMAMENKESLAIQTGLDLLMKFKGRLDRQELYEAELEKWIDGQLAKNPDAAILYIQRSTLADLVGDAKGAVEWMRKFLAKEGTAPFQRALVSNNLAFKLALEGNVGEAQQLLNQALKFFGPRPELRDTQGMIHLANAQFDEAVKEFSAALNEGDPTAVSYVHLAFANYKVGDFSGSESAILAAEGLELDPDQLVGAERKQYDDVVDGLRNEGYLQSETPEIDQQAQSVR